MVTAPFVGPPTVGGVGCAFALDLDHPACGVPSATHILSKAPGWGPVALDTCADHASLARAAGAVMAEHEYGALCPAGDCWTAAS